MVVLNGFKEANDGVEAHFKAVFGESDWIDLRDYTILPCQSCGSCGTRTPGACVLKDDFEQLARRLAKHDSFVFLTPITFGGYSSTLKYFLDRIMCFCLPLYRAYNDKLLHPMRYDWRRLIGIGVDIYGMGQQEVFEKHVAGNALNMQVQYQVYTTDLAHLEDLTIDLKRFRPYEEAMSCY